MAAATVAAVLLWQTGISVWSLAFVLAACVLTTISVLVFGPRRPQVRERATAPRANVVRANTRRRTWRCSL